MSLEGRLRDLGLPEVLQLLGLSRKSGRLSLTASLQGRAAFVRLVQGAVVDAAQWRIADQSSDCVKGAASSEQGARAVESCVLDLLRWRDGEFRFTPDEATNEAKNAPTNAPTGVRFAVDMLLMESAQHAERWERVADRILDAHVVPAFVDVEPQQLPLLRLVPQEWEILTRVDGVRDLTELASALGRDVLDVADIVHGLIGSGLLTLREAEKAPRRNPTPPIGATAQPITPTTSSPAQPSSHPRDLWIPHGDDELGALDDTHDDDSLFDPIEVGVTTHDGLPRNTVAPVVYEPSLQRGEANWLAPEWDATTLCSHGDDAARRGDLAGALHYWSAALRSEASHAEADRIREAIALAARLHALLHPAARRA